MGLQDLFVTPIYLLLFLVGAYFLRPLVTTSETIQYYFPALCLKFFGAIMLGIVYQFYYGFGGDTMNYFNQAGIIYEAFLNDPIIGLKLIFGSNDVYQPELFAYSSRIHWYFADAEYFVIRVLALCSLLTFHAYSSIALFFAVISFAGTWLLFRVFQNRYSHATKYLAYAILFIPSVVFWGSGILKDTLSLGALGILIWASEKAIVKFRFNLWYLLAVAVAAYVIASVKIYILLCAIPALILWSYQENLHRIKQKILRAVMVPVFLAVFLGGGYVILNSVAQESKRYNLESIAKWTYITAYDIRYGTGKNAGSGYDIGEQDGTWPTLLKLAPAAVNVSLFRPYLWEANNPLMLLSALEALMFFLLTLVLVYAIFFRKGFRIGKNPPVLMALVFSVTFAFAVGVSTYNFGSLSRYKVPLMPFYGIVLAVGLSAKKESQ